VGTDDPQAARERERQARQWQERQRQQQAPDPGMWSGVKIGYGMFIVPPLLLIGGCAACAAIVDTGG
jgi:hypothetical protein